MYWRTLVHSLICSADQTQSTATATAGVYVLTWPGTDWFYVGRTVDFRARLKGHNHTARTGKRAGSRLGRVLKKHGPPTMRVLFHSADRTLAATRAYEDGVLPLVVHHPDCVNSTVESGGGMDPWKKVRLLHYKTGAVVEGYISEVARDLGLNHRLVSQVAAGKRASHKGWCVPGSAPVTTRGTIYTFYKQGHTPETGTLAQLSSRLRVHPAGLSNVVCGRARSAGGWTLAPDADPGAITRGVVYELVHVDGGHISGTQADICTALGAGSSQISRLCRGVRRSYKSWRLA